MTERIKNLLKRYGLATVLSVGLISMTSTLTKNTSDEIKLDNSDYIIKYQGSPISLYGYDNNNDGNVDRIEEVGVIPYKTGLPAFRINRTHSPNDKDYAFYFKRINMLGEKLK